MNCKDAIFVDQVYFSSRRTKPKTSKGLRILPSLLVKWMPKIKQSSFKACGERVIGLSSILAEARSVRWILGYTRRRMVMIQPREISEEERGASRFGNQTAKSSLSQKTLNHSRAVNEARNPYKPKDADAQ